MIENNSYILFSIVFDVLELRVKCLDLGIYVVVFLSHFATVGVTISSHFTQHLLLNLLFDFQKLRIVLVNKIISLNTVIRVLGIRYSFIKCFINLTFYQIFLIDVNLFKLFKAFNIFLFFVLYLVNTFDKLE